MTESVQQSLECLQFVNNFVVTDLDPIYSDGHALISTSFVFHKPISFDKSIKNVILLNQNGTLRRNQNF